MMKKRIVSLGLAAMMTAGLFAGCGNSSESQGDSTASGSKSDDIVTLKWVTIGSGSQLEVECRITMIPG